MRSTTGLFIENQTDSLKWILNMTAEDKKLQFFTTDDIFLEGVPISDKLFAEFNAYTGASQITPVTLQFKDGLANILLFGKRCNGTHLKGLAVEASNGAAALHVLNDGLNFAESVISEVNALLVVVDEKGKIKRFNKLCQEMTGLSEDQLIGMDAHRLLMPDSELDSAKKNIADFYKQGKTFSVDRLCHSKKGDRIVRWNNTLLKSPTGDGVYLLCAGTDITEELEAKRSLERLSTHDDLTGLANRRSVEMVIHSLLSSNTAFSTLCVNIHMFRKINDLYGHKKGDAVLTLLADELKRQLRDSDTVARLGGDYFLMVVPNSCEEQATQIATRIIEMCNTPFVVDDSHIQISLSIGVVHSATVQDIKSNICAEDIIRACDSAMHVAKRNNTSCYEVYSEKLASKLKRHLWLDVNLRKAISNEELFLVYQPKISLKTGDIEGVEALIRWKHPEKGIIPPLDFIPFAEESGLIKEIGLWVLKSACTQAIAWTKEGLDLRIAVNISMAQMEDMSIVTAYKDFMLENKIVESPVDIELTESCFSQDPKIALAILTEFKKLGAKLYLDDFGTGYSSLSQLVKIPVDVIKLDRAFVTTCASDTKTQGLVNAVSAVAKTLNCEVVAEGIEELSQAQFLFEAGISFAQGYMYSRPLTAEDLKVWVANYDKSKAVVHAL